MATQQDDTVAGTSGQSIPAAQFSQLMEAIQSSQERFEQKFADFRAEVRQSQEEAAAKALKRARHEKPYAWRKKGHEEQFGFNSRVDEAIAEAQGELASAGSSAALEKATKALERGREIIGERQKLIKIADRSELGWGVVAEYMADELADDSDDEKRIEKAERAAERKAVKRKKAKASTFVPKRAKSGSSLPPGQAVVGTTASSSQPYVAVPRRPQVPATASMPRPLGPCFACGEMGHLRQRCPYASQQLPGTKKWYPPQFCCDSVCDVQCNCEQQFAVAPVLIGPLNCDMEGQVPSIGDNEICPVVDEVLITCSHDLENAVCGWEVEALSPVQRESQPKVKGRLRERLQFWKEHLQAPAFILDTIDSGYVLPLKSEPTPHSRPNQASTVANASFVQQTVDECVQEVPSSPYVCSPLSVVESGSGKKRLVINLRHLNRFLWKQRFKYEDLRVAMLLFEKGDFLFPLI